MLMQPTLEKLSDMRLTGLRRAVEEQLANPQYADLSFEERFSLLVDHEWTRRQDSRLQRRLTLARFRQSACVEDIDFSAERGLKRRQVLQLTTGEWIAQRLADVGPQTALLVKAIMVTQERLEQGFRNCLGIMRLAEDYSASRLEAAAERASLFGALSPNGAKNTLDTNMDGVAVEAEAEAPSGTSHVNVRGSEYYSGGECNADATDA